MGFFESLSGRKKILSFEIDFDDNNNVGVNVSKDVPMIQTPDYIRLWACYEAKIIYNLGYPQNASANVAVGSIAKVVETDINENTNCFKKADVEDVIQYTANTLQGNTKFTGEFYAKGSLERTIKTWFPSHGTEQQVVYSGLALMQYAISITSSDKESLEVFTKTDRNMVKLYDSDMGVGISSVVQVPTFAYMHAIGIEE